MSQNLQQNPHILINKEQLKDLSHPRAPIMEKEARMSCLRAKMKSMGLKPSLKIKFQKIFPKMPKNSSKSQLKKVIQKP